HPSNRPTPKGEKLKARSTGRGDSAFRWLRGGYNIVHEPKGEWRSKWSSLQRSEVKGLKADPPAPWVFEKDEFRTRPPGLYGLDLGPWGQPYGNRVRVFRIAWPSTGVFAPAERSSQEAYNP